MDNIRNEVIAFCWLCVFSLVGMYCRTILPFEWVDKLDGTIVDLLSQPTISPPLFSLQWHQVFLFSKLISACWCNSCVLNRNPDNSEPMSINRAWCHDLWFSYMPRVEKGFWLVVTVKRNQYVLQQWWPQSQESSFMAEKHAVSLKLPTFWTSQPEVWFAQAEAQFNLRCITSDDTKYFYVVAA